MTVTTYTRAPLPSELLHKIITSVLADSIHAISVCPEVTQWDMGVAWTLAGTCFMWKEIVKGILTMAFAIGGDFGEEQRNYSDSEFFHLINIKLTQLRTFGVRSRQPFTTSLPSHPIGMQDSCPLNQSYSLYLTSTALRHNVSQAGELNIGAHESIINALRVALQVCERVKPVGLSKVLGRVLKMEILVVEFGTTLANARMSLDACLVKQGLSSSLMFDVPQTRMQENEELRQYGIKTEMHESLQRVETASCPSCNVLDAGAIEVRQILELSKIIDTLEKYQSLSLDLDEYDVRGRAYMLVERLSMKTVE